jgi:hypothetical protein
MIIQDIDTIATSKIEFWCKSRHWHAKEQIGLGTTLVDLVCIEESKEEETKE